MTGKPIRMVGLKQGAFSLLRSIVAYHRSAPLTADQLEAAEFAAGIVRDLAEDEFEADHAAMLRQAIIAASKANPADAEHHAMLEGLIRESFQEVDNRYDSVFEDVIEVRKVKGFPSTDFMKRSS